MELAYYAGFPFLGIYLEAWEYIYINLCMIVHSNITNNSKTVETIEMSIKWLLNAQNVICLPFMCNVIQQWKEIKCWEMLQHEWTLKTMQGKGNQSQKNIYCML